MPQLTISAPIPVPGTQQQPTVPSSPDFTGNGGTIHFAGTCSDVDVGNTVPNVRAITSTYLPIHQTMPNYYHQRNRNNSTQNTLQRFTSLGGSSTKKLTGEKATLQAKVAELERYLAGLKEELILAHRAIRSKNLEAKQSQERKTVEIHELGQHIQRCEYDLLAKTVECESLQNKLLCQTREQVAKLKHISMLETEIMDYRRRLFGPNHSGQSDRNGNNGNLPMHGQLSRNNPNDPCLPGSDRSSMASQVEEEHQAAQIRQLKEENARKDEQIRELIEQMGKIKCAVIHHQTPKQHYFYGSDTSTISDSTSDADTAISSVSSRSVSSVNSVGYDCFVEHPKLLARYQALRMQHAMAAEHLDALEYENQDLRIQLLNNTAPLTSAFATEPSVESSTVGQSPSRAPSLNRKSSLRYTRDSQLSSGSAVAV
ncbi:hypothetical protein BGX28_005518 [Mortierella sp. GBA30]|nr:hypothetical protein BGX28_005518 [Mortierella sp. GBA30]